METLTYGLEVLSLFTDFDGYYMVVRYDNRVIANEITDEEYVILSRMLDKVVTEVEKITKQTIILSANRRK